MQCAEVYGKVDNICIVGHGSIGKGTLPLIRKHIEFKHITIIDPDPVTLPEESDNVKFLRIGLYPHNYKQVLDRVFTGQRDFCVNLSVGTSSREIIKYCQEKGVLYVDTVKEEWEGHYSDKQLELIQRSNYGLREKLLRDVRQHNLKTTAVSCCGANPGMVSWFVKQALVNLARDLQFPMDEEPRTRRDWALLMKNLGVKGVHIAERDTQRSNDFKPMGAFWNTWSVDGFIAEGYHQPSELGWGTHEKWMPKNAREHREGCKASIYLTEPGMNVMVKSWCPTPGPQLGFLVTHDESISIADFFTVREEGKVLYRPTCHYAYHPCEDAVTSCLDALGSGCPPESPDWKILEREVVTGMDELGVLLYGHAKNAYWYGSQLDIESTRERAPNQNATALQVTSAVLAGMVWALENPEAGLVEADEVDYRRCLEVQHEYISPVRGYYTDWHPLKNKSNELTEEGWDSEDPWQFKNIIMHKH